MVKEIWKWGLIISAMFILAQVAVPGLQESPYNLF